MAIEQLGPKAFTITKKYEALKEKNQGKVDFIRSQSERPNASFKVSISEESARRSADEFERKQKEITRDAEEKLKKVDNKMQEDVKKADFEYENEIEKIENEYERGQREVKKKYEREKFKLRQNYKDIIT